MISGFEHSPSFDRLFKKHFFIACTVPALKSCILCMIHYCILPALYSIYIYGRSKAVICWSILLGDIRSFQHLLRQYIHTPYSEMGRSSACQKCELGHSFSCKRRKA